MKPFGLFLFLKNENKMAEFPIKLRREVVDRLKELIAELEKMILEEKRTLSDYHLKRELELYKADLYYIQYVLRWRLNQES